MLAVSFKIIHLKLSIKLKKTNNTNYLNKLNMI